MTLTRAEIITRIQEGYVKDPWTFDYGEMHYYRDYMSVKYFVSCACGGDSIVTTCEVVNGVANWAVGHRQGYLAWTDSGPVSTFADVVMRTEAFVGQWVGCLPWWREEARNG